MIKVIEPVGATLDNIHLLGDEVEAWYTAQQMDVSSVRPVMLPRSAFILADNLSRRWNIKGLNILNAAVEKIEDPETGEVDFRHGQFPTASQVEGQDLLVIDSVCRTGETLEHCKDAFISLGATSVKTAVLYTKIRDNGVGAYRPDFWVADRSSEFVIFNWEMDEFLPMPVQPADHGIMARQ